MKKLKKGKNKENKTKRKPRMCILHHIFKSIEVALYNQKVKKKPCDGYESYSLKNHVIIKCLAFKSWLKQKVKQMEKPIYQPTNI